MLRVTSSNVLIVPPFECAWLSDEKLQLKNGSGCLDVYVKGENDVTIILKSTPGSKRWQHSSNYTVILGSHRNSCLKFEKNGALCQQVENVVGACVSKDEFTRFWINCNKGSISVGAGPPGTGPWHTWTDPDPLKDIQYVGLSAWDRHVSYRDISMEDAQPLSGSPSIPGPSQAEHTAQPLQNVASLEALCCGIVRDSVDVDTVCACLEVVHSLEPALQQLESELLAYLAANLDRVFEADCLGFYRLPTTVLAQLLRKPSLGCSEKKAFDALLAWASAGLASTGLPDLEALLPLIRFPLMSDSELEEVLRHPFTRGNSTLEQLVEEARHVRGAGGPLEGLGPPCLSVEAKRHVRAAERPESDAAVRFQRRLVPSCTELMYGWDGDCNGVIHHIGCNFGKSAWVNPVLAGRLTVKASSPICRHTDPRALVSRSFLRANWAGPARASATSLRQDGSGAAGRRSHDTTGPALTNDAEGPARSPGASLRQDATGGEAARPSRDPIGPARSPGASPRQYSSGDAGRPPGGPASPASPGSHPPGAVLTNPRGGRALSDDGAGPSRQELGGRGMEGPPPPAGSSWWLLDLGDHARLLPNYYTLRHDGSLDYLRSWSLQGSCDGETWIDLRRHANDGTLRMAGQYASWPVPDTGNPPFRMFRILLTGPSASPGPRSDTIALSGLELYGYLSRGQ